MPLAIFWLALTVPLAFMNKHVHGPAIRAARIVAGCSDSQIGDAIAVEIAERRDRTAEAGRIGQASARRRCRWRSSGCFSPCRWRS